MNDSIPGIDIPVEDLVPLRERNINFDKHPGFKKIVASIKAIGLVEPLCVFQDNGKYTILDGFLRFKACQRLGLGSLPCLVYKNKEAYTFNRMVNKLSPVQESNMMRKALGAIDEDKIAATFGMKSVKHLVNTKLMKSLHPKVIQALDESLLTRKAAEELSFVVPARQSKILQEMERLHDFSSSFARALVLKTPEEQRSPDHKSGHWVSSQDKAKTLTDKLKEAEERHDFYRGLYMQYSNDLLKMSAYVRKLVTHDQIKGFLAVKFPDALKKSEEIVFDDGQGGRSGRARVIEIK